MTAGSVFGKPSGLSQQGRFRHTHWRIHMDVTLPGLRGGGRERERGGEALRLGKHFVDPRASLSPAPRFAYTYRVGKSVSWSKIKEGGHGQVPHCVVPVMSDDSFWTQQPERQRQQEIGTYTPRCFIWTGNCDCTSQENV
ncbi:unnamed protein product [Ixodes pacificus]